MIVQLYIHIVANNNEMCMQLIRFAISTRSNVLINGALFCMCAEYIGNKSIDFGWTFINV